MRQSVKHTKARLATLGLFSVMIALFSRQPAIMATAYPAAVTLAYNAIMRSSVFKLHGPAIDLPRALALLGQALDKYDLPEGIWGCLGEFSEACLGDLIVGAYWALSEWSGGQASDTYAALCSLGQVFKPGMTSGPEVDSGEFTAYELIGDWFKEREDR